MHIFIATITAGISPTTQTALTPAGILTDLQTAVATLSLQASSKLFAIVSGSFYNLLSLKGDTAGSVAFESFLTIGTVSFVASDAVTSTDIVVCDASQLAIGSTTIGLQASDKALIQLDGSPDSPVTASTSLVSLWQQGLVAVKGERQIGVVRARTTSVAVIQ